MSQSPRVSPELFAESMRGEVEQYLKQIMDAAVRHLHAFARAEYERRITEFLAANLN